MPGNAPWHIQQQENHAQRQPPRVERNIAKVQPNSQGLKQESSKVMKPLNLRERPRVYRQMRDAKTVK
jgi:hypothetical protein